MLSQGPARNNPATHQTSMFQNTKELYDHKLTARDGEIGSVKDFYFETAAHTGKVLKTKETT